MLRKLLLALVLATAACGPKAPAVDPSAMTRATARAAVSVAKNSYVLVATACLDAQVLATTPKVAIACGAFLDPAYTLIVGAAEAVDTGWSPTAACELAQATALVAKAVGTIGALGASMAPVVADANLLATGLLGSYVCAPPAPPPPPAPPVTDAGGPE